MSTLQIPTINFEELNKLEEFLQKSISSGTLFGDYVFQRFDLETPDVHQIVVYEVHEDDHHLDQVFDAVISPITYGYRDGLLEIAGKFACDGMDTVRGWLTGEQVFELFQQWDKESHEV